MRRFLNRYYLLILGGVLLLLAGVGLNLGGGSAPWISLVLFMAAVLLFASTVPVLHFTLLRPYHHLRRQADAFARRCFGEVPCDQGDLEGFAEGLQQLGDAVDQADLRTRELEATVKVYALEKEQMETILWSLPIAILVTDRFNELLMANDAAQRMFGFQRQEGNPRPMEEILPWAELVDLIKGTAERKLKVPRRTVELNRDLEEETRIYRVTLASITDHADEILCVVTIIQDITKDREIERMKSEFVANVSHELKAPLGAIKAYSEMLLDGEAKDEASRLEFMEVIAQETDRLSGMIENLLDLSRLEAGVVQMNMQRLNLINLLQSVVTTIRPSAEMKKIDLETDISQYIVPVTGDEEQLGRVFMNLLSNAVKYTPEGGKVDLTARLEGDFIRVDVADTGYGIPEEDLPRIFEKFFRVKKNRKVAKGTGMGLAMVKRILEIHNAEIKVESEPGKGSCFTVFIPAAK